MAVRIFLGLSAFIWLPYGLYCFFNPAFLADAAGVASNSAMGTTELRAMYGGLQAGIGTLAALAVMRPPLVRPALTTLAFLCSGLFLSRVAAAVIGGEFSSYTVSALGIEIVSAAVAIHLLSRNPETAAV